MAQDSNSYVAAIDLGTTKVVTIVGKRTSTGRLHVVGFSTTESTGIKKGMIQNIDETVKAIEKTVRDVENQIGNKITSAFVGIAGQHIHSIKNFGYITLGPEETEIKRDDIKRLIADMYNIPVETGDSILHVLPLDFSIDNVKLEDDNPVGMLGRRLGANFHIVIGKTSSAKHIERCVERVGVKVSELILEPLASSKAVLTEEEKEAGVALIDIGGGTTDLAVYYNGIVRHTAVIPFGGNIISQDIKEGCQILQKHADLLKCHHGIALTSMAPDNKIVTVPGISGREPKEISMRSLAGIIQARMEEILDYALYEIQMSGFADKLSAGVVLTGGGALLKHLVSLIKFHWGYDVRIGYPSEGLCSESVEQYNYPQYSTAIGLAIMGLERIEAGEAKPCTGNNLQHDEQNGDEPDDKPNKKSTKRLFGMKFYDAISKLFTEEDMEM
ncbi:MAG: cell division protein FtsA [Tenuifilum sp.]|jgi:cell division protein FtsA|uniref:cell division protein FtsA n=1 Tax=Tenuifilum sp. TaxID=2760880 RepID=UPI0024ABBFB6|nr:cell division protein FtsA [Tenuifilum sp.]MDI3526182.1 cell division protein FtsA [Tenuifilum sp.]